MGIKGRPGWSAIDINENFLFAVINQSYGEPTPDYLIENKIRIEDTTGKIGYANELGEIIIEPKFEMGSVFNKGKAIVAFGCEKVPWGNHENENGCHHFSLVCKSFRAINVKGKYISKASESFEALAKNINWENPELF